MSDSLNYEAMIADAKERLDKVNAQITAAADRVAEENRRITALREEGLQIVGEIRAVSKLKDGVSDGPKKTETAH